MAGTFQADNENYLVYDVFRAFWTRVVGLFFREVAERNAHLIPRTGPVIFVVAPHHNQFVDPVILLMHAVRRVYFLVAAASMRRKFIGFYGRALRGIPVERQQDLAKTGSGRIKLEDRYAEPTLISGIDTKFTTELKPGYKISLSKNAGQAKVVEVISDTQIRIAKEMKELEAIGLLTSADGATYKCIPHIDQDEMYRAVYDRFNKGECVGIFPEGGSHDRTEMLPLKAGATIMALGATAENPDLGLKIVPTGLNYFHPSKFRSRAVIDFGAPIEVPAELVAKYKQGGEAKRQACDQLLHEVSEGLKQVTLNTPDYETLKLTQAGRRLYKPLQHSLSMAQQVELTRRFIKGYSVYKDLPEVKDLAERVEDYNAQLRYYGIRDHQVETMQIGRAEAGMLFLWRLVWLFLMGAIALPGVILNIPVFVVTGIFSKKKAKAALAASTVKVRARDVIATWKILIALGLVPFLYTLASLLSVWFVRRMPSHIPSSFSFIQTWSSLQVYCAAYALAALVSYTALIFGEQAMDIVKSVRPLFLTLILGQEHTELLVRQREELSTDITDLVNELGPKIYPEFSKTRIMRSAGPVDNGSSAGGAGANALHDIMHRGEQAIRQRIIAATSSKSHKEEEVSKADVEEEHQPDEGPPRIERRQSKYKFNPPTPGTMAKLNAISPMEFLGTGGSDQPARRKPAASTSAASAKKDDEGASATPTTGNSTPLQTQKARGLFDFSWEDTASEFATPTSNKSGQHHHQDDGVHFFGDAAPKTQE